MKKKKKKMKKVYCSNGPCQGETFKIESEDREFWVVTPTHLLYKKVHYKIVERIGFVNELIAIYVGHFPRKRND